MSRKKHRLGKIRAGRYNYRGYVIERYIGGTWAYRGESGDVIDMRRTLALMTRRIDQNIAFERRREREFYERAFR